MYFPVLSYLESQYKENQYETDKDEPEYIVPAQLAGERERGKTAVVLDVGVGVLARVPQSVPVHALQKD